MNERIKELAEQATEYDYTTWDSHNQKEVVHYKFNQQKFAELIVQECANYAEYQLQIGGFKADKIKEHFGVKE